MAADKMKSFLDDEEDVAIPEVEEQEGAAEEPEVSAELPNDDDIEVVFEKDNKYGKKDWDKDPADNIEDGTDALQRPNPKKRIDTLTASLTEAARQRDVLARDKDELLTFTKALHAQVTELQKQVFSGRTTSLTAQAEAEEARVASAKEAYVKAADTGNMKDLVEANEALASAKAKADRFRQELEVAKAAKVPEPAAFPAQRQQVQQIDTTKRDQWAAKNTWFSMDEDGLPQNLESVTAIKAHNAALKAGAIEGSDAYFSHIDNTVKAAHPKLFASRASAATVTPSSRVATQQTNAEGRRRFIIKPETVKLARELGFTSEADIKRFALNQEKSIKRGFE